MLQRERLRLRTLAAASLLVLGIGLAAWLSWEPPNQAPRSVVRVGLYENEPKVYTRADGEPAGLFVELLEAVAAAEGWSLRYQPCGWQDCLELLASGLLDLMPDVAYSSERARRFDFNEVSVAGSWAQVYTHPDLRVSSLAELNGRRIAILAGGIQEHFFRRLMAGSGLEYQALPVDSLEQGYAAVKAGQADAVVTNSFYAARNASRYRLRETPIVFLPSNLYFATAKGRNAELLEAIDEHLTQWRHAADSIYYKALHRSMALPPEVLLPPWLGWSLVILLGGLLLLAGVSLLLRWQVSQRTRDLLASTRELEAQRGQLEQAVAERSGELQAIFNSSSVGILLLKERVMVRCNRRMEELCGYQEGELQGQSTRVWYLDDASWERDGCEADRPVWRGQAQVREQEVRRKDGSRFWARITTRAVDPGDRSKGRVAVIQDISDERAALEQMERAKLLAESATRMKSEFLANMSHEIRTPINAILGMQYLALRQPALPERARDQLEKAQSSAQALLGVINDILDFSRIEAGKISLEAVELELEDLLQQVRDSLGLQAAEKGIELLIRRDAQIPARLIGDPLRLGQVLLNLCGNAVKFTERGGKVELSLLCLERQADVLTLQACVRDTGVGMSTEVQAGLFQAFSQADQSTTRRFGGSGLGLVISKRLVSLMGGRIWLAESRPGVGSKFCFSVQLGVAQSDQPARTEHASTQDLNASRTRDRFVGARLLLVEDNTINREFALELLRGEGYRVDEAHNGAEALQQVQRVDYDLVLMDIQMPVMDGLEAARRIRALADSSGDARYRTMPIIAMTAMAMAQDVEKSKAIGMNDHLCKPVMPEELLALLQRWIEQPGAMSESGAATHRAAGEEPARLKLDLTAHQSPGEEPARLSLDLDASGAPGSAAHLPPELRNLRSLDLRAGLHRIGGRLGAYREQLRRFRTHNADAVAQLESLLTAPETDAAMAFCHALKGVAGNLGAMDLFHRLSAIDADLRQSRRPAAAQLDQLRVALADLLREIDQVLELTDAACRHLPVQRSASQAEAPTERLQPQAVQRLLIRLSRALEEDLGAADAPLNALRAGLSGGALETAIEAIASAMDRFEIDTAQTQVQGLRERLQPQGTALKTDADLLPGADPVELVEPGDTPSAEHGIAQDAEHGIAPDAEQSRCLRPERHLDRPRSPGFSLIELMIVVAVVGILAALSIPAYQAVVTRAKVSEGLTLLGPVKTALVEYQTVNGDLPSATNWLMLLRELGLPVSTTSGAASGEYVERIWWNSTERQIRIRYRMAPIKDKLLYLQAEIGALGQMVWRCFAPSGSDGVPARYLPASCRH